MSVTLQVDGREFSLEEIEAIVRQHFSEKKEFPKNENKTVVKPEEGKWFEVKPGAINQELFQEKREEKRQEQTRQLILEAFAEAAKKPEKYGKPFKTMMPKRTWDYKTVRELKELAEILGDHNADWVEQALEWAQRIQNGETWEDVCNKPDTANWFRLVVWKNGHARLVGGSRRGGNGNAASYVSNYNFNSYSIILSTVPLVVLYK